MHNCIPLNIVFIITNPHSISYDHRWLQNPNNPIFRDTNKKYSQFTLRTGVQASNKSQIMTIVLFININHV
jgi:hypothetical protein